VLTLAPMLKVEVYVPRPYLERVLFNIGKEGLLHLVDAKEDFYEEIAKGLLKPIDVSARLYKISLLSSRAERTSSILNLASSRSFEDLKEEEVLSFSSIRLRSLSRLPREIAKLWRRIDHGES